MRIHEAIEFAAVKHRGQVRKGTDIPYIVHPMEVMYILTQNDCDETTVIAGLLHDTIEDAGEINCDGRASFVRAAATGQTAVGINVDDIRKGTGTEIRHSFRGWPQNNPLAAVMAVGLVCLGACTLEPAPPGGPLNFTHL